MKKAISRERERERENDKERERERENDNERKNAKKNKQTNKNKNKNENKKPTTTNKQTNKQTNKIKTKQKTSRNRTLALVSSWHRSLMRQPSELSRRSSSLLQFLSICINIGVIVQGDFLSIYIDLNPKNHFTHV